MGDLVFGIILLLALFYGWRLGVVKIIGGVGAVVGGIFLARRITPLVLPWLEQTFGWSVDQALTEATGSPILSTLFFSDTQMGRLVELILFIIIVAIVTWLLRKAANLVGGIINMTPLVGYISRVLGAALSLVTWAVLIYAAYAWLLPWLTTLIPAVGKVNDLFDSSVYLFPIIKEIGLSAWYLAANGIASLNQRPAA